MVLEVLLKWCHLLIGLYDQTVTWSKQDGYVYRYMSWNCLHGN